MKFAIFGASGMLGHVLSKLSMLEGHDVTLFSRKPLPGNLSKLKYEFFDAKNYDPSCHNFDFVVNCCGVIKQRKEIDEQFYCVNEFFPKKLAEKYGSRMIHISTDCVFSGKKGNYSEIDDKDCEDVYGSSKSRGEDPRCRVLRTSIIGSHQEDSSGLLEWMKNNKEKEVQGYVDHIWSGVTTYRLSKIIIQNLDKSLPSVTHIYSNKISKFELLQKIKESYGLSQKIIPVFAGRIDRSLTTIYKDNISNGDIVEQLRESLDFERLKI